MIVSLLLLQMRMAPIRLIEFLSLQKKQRRLIWSLEVEREKFDKFH